MNIDEIINQLITDTNLQNKFNDFDNNKDIFGVTPKDEYYSLLYKYIEKEIKRNIQNNNFKIDYILDFANKFIRSECVSKPYLIEFDKITETLCELATHYDSLALKSSGDSQKKELYTKKSKILKMLGSYKNNFSSTIEFNEIREKQLLNFYKNKLENNGTLSLKETEELGYLFCCDSIKENEKKIYLNYLLKNILENNYDINFQIYKNIFKSKCEEVLNSENINLDLLFRINGDNVKRAASFSEENNAIIFDKNNTNSTEMIQNFRSFFHELRHYKQINSSKVNVSQLNFAKDKMLKKLLGYSYYNDNYDDISYEKDAIYSSSEEVIKFIHEFSPVSVEKAKNVVKEDIKKRSRKTSIDTTERLKPSLKEHLDIVNFNLLFESVIGKKGKLLKSLLEDSKSYMVLLHEYNINGSKKDLLELLSSRDENIDNKELYSFYNYLIYDVEVSFSYIIKNACKLKSMKEREYNSELESIIKNRLVKYSIAKKRTKINALQREEEHANETLKTRQMLAEEISGLRKRIIERFRKDKNIEVYLTSEEELRNGYTYLSQILAEEEKKKRFAYFEAEEMKSHQL